MIRRSREENRIGSGNGGIQGIKREGKVGHGQERKGKIRQQLLISLTLAHATLGITSGGRSSTTEYRHELTLRLTQLPTSRVNEWSRTRSSKLLGLSTLENQVEMNVL